ncbi:MAG: hypothetical protein IH991_08955 [Planctomycetes bacterium]|nr:hypothetical protein [Planctomycetota bacterium]
MREYLDAAISQHVQRGRTLKSMIPRGLNAHFQALAQTCRNEIDRVLDELTFLNCTPEMLYPGNQPERLRAFRRQVEDLDDVENIGIAALSRSHPDDDKLNRLVEQIVREINYPLPLPTVSSLSQSYFKIYPKFNLLCVPLSEGRFLLHLPDLYHELAHPLLTEKNNPSTEPYQQESKAVLMDVVTHTQREILKVQRNIGLQGLENYFQCWEFCWVKWWLVEFFCDLFSVYTLGPAFAWSHLHLCAKRGGDPFHVPTNIPTHHPADAARMAVLLIGLSQIDFRNEAGAIQDRWEALNATRGASVTPEYQYCFPNDLLTRIAEGALDGVMSIGCRIAKPTTDDTVHKILNDAWLEFWRDPDRFSVWETDAVDQLYSTASVD